MDNIWDENLLKSEVIGRCGGDEETKWPGRTNKKQKNNPSLVQNVLQCKCKSPNLIL